jgi:ABC-2 type transport system ATP-binding protein
VPIIRIVDLVKEFRIPKRHDGIFGGVRTLFTRQSTITRAVDGISFSVDEGEVLGYIGANGAGKSTTIKVLTGILVPTSGVVEVNGLVPWQARERNALNIGVVFGQRSQLWWDLPLEESFKLIAALYRIPQARYKRNMERFTEMLGLDEFIHSPVRSLSLGQRMRGDFVAAMLYEPRLLYLDEPTVGLDVMAKERIRAFIEEVSAEGHTTIMLTTHDLSDVERLCRRIILVDHGRVLYDGTVDHLKARYAPYRVLVVQQAEGDDAAVDVTDAEVIRCEEGRTWLRFDPEHISIPALIAEVAAHYAVTDLSIEEPDLEYVVRGLYDDHPSRRAACDMQEVTA